MDGEDLSESPLPEHLVVRARGLGKTYRLGEVLSVHRLLKYSIESWRGNWVWLDPLIAVRDVDFEIRRGECFALIGENGSGKSTIVQLLSQITVPTRGWLRVRGRVLPLMEVGAGFHLELTGRENVTLVGTIQGLSREEIREAMPGIAAFAEVEQHLDTPLKRYSMGMQARLSFAIAMRFPADIYVFDEVLAVVDDRFRAICVEEIRRLRAEGRTVVVISHDLDLIRSLADRGLWIHKGDVQRIGPIAEVADAYTEFERRRARERGAELLSD